MTNYTGIIGKRDHKYLLCFFGFLREERKLKRKLKEKGLSQFLKDTEYLCCDCGACRQIKH